MYTVMLVDDEKIIREGLQHIIEKSCEGFEVLSCCSDGSDAIEYLKENEVDVVLTDIKMTKISGLELAKYIYNSKPDTKVILLSGYKEFEYAKKAMEYNVKYYLLKPTDYSEVKSVFANIKEILDDDKRLQRDLKHYEEVQSALKDEFFSELALGALTETEVSRKLTLLNLGYSFTDAPCTIIDFEIYDYEAFIGQRWEHGKDRLSTVFQNIIAQSSDEIYYHLVFQRDSYIKAFAVAKVKMSADEMDAIIDKHIVEIKETLKAIFYIDIIEAKKGFDNINELVRNIVMIRAQNKEDQTLVEIEWLKLLISHISSGDSEGVLGMFDSYIFNQENIPLEQLRDKVFDLFDAISKNLGKMGIHSEYSGIMEDDYHSIKTIDNINDLRNRGKAILVKMVAFIIDNSSTSEDIIIKKAKLFIEDNFQRDISLQDVADQVFLSPMYFSRFFKQHIGESFSDYLIKTRMNYAIKLLAQRRKIEDVSYMSGYRSSRYFTRVFKRYTGYTPREYFRRVLSMAGERND